MATSDTQDVGIKLSQPGFDARSCPDYKLIFNSSWPVLKIVKQDQTTLSASSAVDIYTHDLGYYPMFLIWEVNGSGWQLANNDFYSIRVNRSKLYTTAGAGSAVNIRYMIFAVDMETQYTAPNKYLQTDTTAAKRDYDYGIKMAKDGADIDSADFRDFILHSACRSPMVHSVNPQDYGAAGAKVYTIDHNMKKAPMAYAYLIDTTNNRMQFCDISPESSSGVALVSTSTQVIAGMFAAGKITIVVLKDPIFLA